MKKKYLWIIILAIVLVAGSTVTVLFATNLFKKGSQSNEGYYTDSGFRVAPEDKDFQSEDDEEKPITVDLSELDSFLEQRQRQNDLMRKELTELTPKQADSMFLQFDYNVPDIDNLAKIVSEAIDRWGNSCGENAGADCDRVVNKMTAKGFKPIYLGEGCAELGVDREFFFKIFKPYISAEIRDYAELDIKTNRILCFDAGLGYDMETLIEWSVDWEKFLDRYPDTRTREKVLENYKTYMDLTMFCTYDNTPSYDYQTKIYEDYVIEGIEKGAKKYKGTQTAKILNEFLKRIRTNGMKYSESLEEQIKAMGLLAE